MEFQRVLLAGTTAGTTWRQEVIQRLKNRGVQENQIFNSQPHNHTEQYMRSEETAQDDRRTILLIYICPGSINKPSDQAGAEVLDAFTMYLVGTYGMWRPHRTAIIFEDSAFNYDGESYRVLKKIRSRLVFKFGEGGPPCFETLAKAEDWIVMQLT